jgi:hypothetical protein
MSLKHFHIFFIVASIALTAGFGLWCFLTEDGAALAGSKWMGSISLVAAVALVVYILRIPAKLRG